MAISYHHSFFFLFLSPSLWQIDATCLHLRVGTSHNCADKLGGITEWYIKRKGKKMSLWWKFHHVSKLPDAEGLWQLTSSFTFRILITELKWHGPKTPNLLFLKIHIKKLCSSYARDFSKEVENFQKFSEVMVCVKKYEEDLQKITIIRLR